jgi:hypothetical protein
MQQKLKLLKSTLFLKSNRRITRKIPKSIFCPYIVFLVVLHLHDSAPANQNTDQSSHGSPTETDLSHPNLLIQRCQKHDVQQNPRSAQHLTLSSIGLPHPREHTRRCHSSPHQIHRENPRATATLPPSMVMREEGLHGWPLALAATSTSRSRRTPWQTAQPPRRPSSDPAILLLILLIGSYPSPSLPDFLYQSLSPRRRHRPRGWCWRTIVASIGLLSSPVRNPILARLDHLDRLVSELVLWFACCGGQRRNPNPRWDSCWLLVYYPC